MANLPFFQNIFFVVYNTVCNMLADDFFFMIIDRDIPPEMC